MMKNIILLTLFLFFLELTAQNINYNNKVIPREKIGVHNRNFKLGGFYYSKRLQVKSKNDTAKYIDPMIFFKDGTIINFAFFGNSSTTLRVEKKGKKCILKPRQDFDTVIDFVKYYTEIVKRKKIHSFYSIGGNILRIQHVGPNFFVEQRGIVLNDSTFVLNNKKNYITKEVVNKNFKYQFQTSKKPDSAKLKPTSLIKKYFFR